MIRAVVMNALYGETFSCYLIAVYAQIVSRCYESCDQIPSTNAQCLNCLCNSNSRTAYFKSDINTKSAGLTANLRKRFLVA